METDKMGGRIRALRTERELTQEGLAEALNVSAQAVSKWENGHSLPETAILPALSRALDCSMDCLFGQGELYILDAWYSDGFQKQSVTSRLNRLLEGDALRLDVFSILPPVGFDKGGIYLCVKYQIPSGIFYKTAQKGQELVIASATEGIVPPSEGLHIIEASYGAADKCVDVMRKIEHYAVFGWSEYSANHETFPSDPSNDGPDYLTICYINSEGLHVSACEEGEGLAYNHERTALVRRHKKDKEEHFIRGVEHLPPFGQGNECSWGAALTAGLRAMGHKTSYEQVMGVSGACYRLAFCAPQWDYSSVDGLVAYDYAAPGFKAYGYSPVCTGRIEKEKRAEERRRIVDEVYHDMPVLGINLRVAPEWGVICGYKNSGADLYCRTKYDTEVLASPDFQKGSLNEYDYLYVDNWPFLILYFSDKKNPPSDKDNLYSSLRVFADSASMEGGGYHMGFKAYKIWAEGLRDGDWYTSASDEQVERRLSVDQFCTLSLYDARRAAHAYLSSCLGLLDGAQGEALAKISDLFGQIAVLASQAHSLIDTGEYLQGARARAFFTSEVREKQAGLLDSMALLERKAYDIVLGII
ncbi:MAG: helix-turn-helix domain-containing protein [Eubacteriales bacterium]